MSGSHRGPPSAQGSFARSGCYPSRRSLDDYVRERYLSFIAHTNPCARPNPSRRLWFPTSPSLCRLRSAPAGRWPFPVLSLQSLLGCLDPYPAALLRCFCPFLPGEHRSHPTETGYDATEKWPIRNFNDPEISGLQSFANVQAPRACKGPLIAPTDGTLRSQGGWAPIHHAELVRLPDTSSGIATSLNRTIDSAGLSPAGLQPYRLLLPCVPWFPYLT